MNDDAPQQDRSPRSPTIPLEEAIETTRKLYQQARATVIKPDVAVRALGYSSTNGAAMTTLATLAQYGLIDRTGGNVAVTPLAVKIFHPVSQAQKTQAIQEAANTPTVFRELLKGFEECTVDVVTGHLIQNRFTPERAKKVAQVFISNLSFAGTAPQIEAKAESNEVPKSGVTGGNSLSNVPSHASVNSPQVTFPAVVIDPQQKMLAQYNIPLGANQAQLTFVGQDLTPDDFDELIEFVTFTKRQLVRRIKSAAPPPPPQSAPVSFVSDYPKQAIWKNADHDKEVTIVGEMGERDGVKFYQTPEGTGIPGTELDFDSFLL